MPRTATVQGYTAMLPRESHLLAASTVCALRERKNGQSLRAVAAVLGLPTGSAGMLSAVMREAPGAVSLDSENDLRRRLGLPAIAMRQALACPTCGAVHGEGLDCHGQPVTVALRPVRSPPPPRPCAEPIPATVIMWQCPYCDMVSRSRYAVQRHAARYCKRWHA